MSRGSVSDHFQRLAQIASVGVRFFNILYPSTSSFHYTLSNLSSSYTSSTRFQTLLILFAESVSRPIVLTSISYYLFRRMLFEVKVGTSCFISRIHLQSNVSSHSHKYIIPFRLIDLVFDYLLRSTSAFCIFIFTVFILFPMFWVSRGFNQWRVITRELDLLLPSENCY